jgi:ABC-type polar amino acid transport system ATPase subunit
MSRTSDAPTLHVEALHLARAHRAVLQGVSLTVHPGTVSVLVGTSGAGKSTLLRTIVALEPFDRGRIQLGPCLIEPGPVPPESQLRALRRRVGMVFQQHALFTHLTVRENVTLAPIHALGAAAPHAATIADALLASLGVAHRGDAYPNQISGGEAQRVAIARALAVDPPLLLMDEPTAALDPARRGALADSLRTLASQGRALLITTHDVEFARAVADVVSVLDGGLVVDQGAPAEVLPRYLARMASSLV